MPECEFNLDDPWDAHKMEQILFQARSTTPQQRMEWLEEMLELFQEQLIAQRKLKQIEIDRIWGLNTAR